jgi:hypothetical protein
MKRKPKVKSSKVLRQECLKTIQRLCRLAAADDDGNCACVSCGCVKHYSQLQGGHWLAKGSSSFWALRIENVHPQCASCNMWGMRYGSAAQQYTLWMEDMYGRDFVEEMISTKSNPIKLYKADYEEMLEEFNEQIKHHENRLR